ncbi:hypothetical protein J6590_051571 [Homalodisca vitripennis]|nr:hypothetical protein J6590_051571 [Homalodisca vitripennis]
MASALVQMTAFSPCSQLSYMIMIGMEASLESFPGSRDEGNKRSHSDGDEDQDRRSGSQGMGDMDFSETGEHFLTEGLVEVNANSLAKAEEYEDRDQKNQELNKIFMTIGIKGLRMIRHMTLHFHLIYRT